MDLLVKISNTKNSTKTASSLEEQAVQSLAQKVVDFTHIPDWMKKDRKYIIRSYRVQSNSFWDCYYSLWYLHNETVNIWSHLLVGIFFFSLLIWNTIPKLHGGYIFHAADLQIIQWYLLSSSMCLFCSVSSFLSYPKRLHLTMFMSADLYDKIMTLRVNAKVFLSLCKLPL